MILFHNRTMIKIFLKYAPLKDICLLHEGKANKKTCENLSNILGNSAVYPCSLYRIICTVYSNVMLHFAMQALLLDQLLRSCILYF